MVSNSKAIPWYYFLFGGGVIVVAFILIHKAMYKTTAKVATTNQDTNSTRGQRNNNPLNIRPLKKTQPGQTGISDNFIVFSSIEYGYRLGIKLLWEYWADHDCKTIRRIITRWAPAEVDHNTTATYIAFVAKDSGINADKLLNFNDRSDYDKVMIAMSVYESKIRPTETQLNKAWELASK
jgi:hypothetical protein